MRVLKWCWVAVTALAVTGCGVVSPVVTEDPAEPLPVITIGSDGTAVSELVASLYVAALKAAGEPAEVVEVTPGTETLALGDNHPMAMPVYAATWLQEFSTEPATFDTATTITDLATAVAPAIGVLESSAVDGGLVWAVDPESELVSLTDLAALPAGTAVVAPAFAMTSASGVPALEAAYGAKLAAEPLDDPAERAAALADGHAAAAFRRTESIDLAGLDVLTDPVGILTPDPLVAAVSAEFADQRPDAVLVLDAVQSALTDDSLAELAASAAVDGLDPALAQWLAERGLS